MYKADGALIRNPAAYVKSIEENGYTLPLYNEDGKAISDPVKYLAVLERKAALSTQPLEESFPALQPTQPSEPPPASLHPKPYLLEWRKHLSASNQGSSSAEWWKQATDEDLALRPIRRRKEKGSIACNYFSQDRCRKGANCAFSHEYPDGDTPENKEPSACLARPTLPLKAKGKPRASRLVQVKQQKTSSSRSRSPGLPSGATIAEHNEHVKAKREHESSHEPSESPALLDKSSSRSRSSSRPRSRKRRSVTSPAPASSALERPRSRSPSRTREKPSKECCNCGASKGANSYGASTPAAKLRTLSASTQSATSFESLA
jgi:hypothetical protein